MDFKTLSDVYGEFGPMAYQKGEQFIQEELQQKQQKTYADGLANQFNTQNNPIKVQQGQATLDQTLYGNRKSAVEADIAEQTRPFVLSDAQRQDVLKASEAEIKMMGFQARKFLQSSVPAEIEKGRKMLAAEAASIEARQKHAEALELRRLQDEAADRRQTSGNNAQLAAARIGADGRIQVANMRKEINTSVEAQLVGAKDADQRVGIYEAGARAATLKGDDELAKYYGQMAQRDRQGIIDARGAATAVTQEGKPSLPALGIETQGKTTPPSIAQPLPGMATTKPSNTPVLKELPAGSVKIGTSGGKPVYRTPDGSRFIGD